MRSANSVKQKKKLIEVALPLDAIDKASAQEKSIRLGHPGTPHLWWARRPLAAARAVIFAQMADDPSAHPDIFKTEKAQEKERHRLFRIIEDLVLWENTTNETVLQAACDEIWRSWRYTCAENADHPRAKELFDRHKLPTFHDPFAGGGSIPLEAQRLGLESYAGDLNLKAVLINKAMIEIPPKFTGKPPVSPESRSDQSLFERKKKVARTDRRPLQIRPARETRLRTTETLSDRNRRNDSDRPPAAGLIPLGVNTTDFGDRLPNRDAHGAT
jgi:putative DNA methylase